MQHIAGLDKWVDVLTKPISPPRFIFLKLMLKRAELHVISPPP